MTLRRQAADSQSHLSVHLLLLSADLQSVKWGESTGVWRTEGTHLNLNDHLHFLISDFLICLFYTSESHVAYYGLWGILLKLTCSKPPLLG